ncbi:beta-galactosidase [Victivallis vadensis]|uniref:beta-galactosidase n=1 Tax=Victivallis vadensis TaxID=172901 RepID=UPI00266CCE8F|nr:beta-galactosidase [Victivallis vadensis]
MKTETFDFFPYGCQYHRAPTPPREEWEGDLAEIARAGYTHVQFRPQWRCHERRRGEFVWDDLDRLFDLAARNRLRVILKAQLENAPDWVFTELGGTRIGFHNQPLDPIAHAAFYVGGWWPCFDNPRVAEAATEFTRQLAERYKGHPALWFYNAWNEPRSRPLGQCRCEHSVASYRDWLRGRYGTIEALNAAFGKAWTAFDTVFPPHSHSDYAELFLWRQWAAEAVAEQVALSVRGFRAADPERTVMCHVGCSSLVQDPACDTSNDFLNAAEVDRYGCSFPIELHPANLIDRNAPLYQSSWLRRVDPGFWCQEFYTNYANWHKEPEPDFIEQAVWMAIASGCRGLTFWQYKSERFGEESNGWGMREIDGSPTRRSERCDRIAGVLKELGADFAASRPARSKAAIWFDLRNDLLMRIEEMRSELNHIEEIRASTDYSCKQAAAADHTILRRLGVTADFVVSGDDLSGCRLLVADAVELVDEAAAAWLTGFVRDGGTLLIGYPFACRDERTWVTPQRPARGLEALTGCRETLRVALPAGEIRNIRWENGAMQAAAGWQVILDPAEDADVVGRWEDGSPAAVRHAFGNGQVVTCGGNFAMAFFRQPDRSAIPPACTLAMELAGLEACDSLLWRCSRYSESCEYRFLFNAGGFTEAEPGRFEPVYASPGCTSAAGRLGIPPFGTVILRGTPASR